MSKLKLFFCMVAIVILFGASHKSYAQNGPVMYFCSSYGSSGEIDISDRFTTGYLTVMVKCSYALGLSDCHIQFDKLNMNTGKFDYYKKFPYTVSPDMSYIYFEGEDLSFDKSGIYRVFLLDSKDRTVTSALIEIIPKK
ncbi:MAG: hypothetical protein JST55_10055 [Bacteroidetes bacterium]|nr:hypothetical protein [Bacteroidota bacterium]